VQESSSRQWLIGLWYALSLAYCATRVYLANRYVRPYGLNIGVFATVEILASIPYAIGTAKLVSALADRRSAAAARWGLLASAGFFAPDLFMLLSTDEAPSWLTSVLLGWLTVAIGLTVVRTLQAVNARKI
jgi:hypothetical protein